MYYVPKMYTISNYHNRNEIKHTLIPIMLMGGWIDAGYICECGMASIRSTISTGRKSNFSAFHMYMNENQFSQAAFNQRAKISFTFTPSEMFASHKLNASLIFDSIYSLISLRN